MIKVNDLRKAFGPIKAVDGVSFSAATGEVLGFLGPNGAGKTTTMKMLSCFLPPDSGTAEIGGFSINKHPVDVRRNIGYLAENAPAYEEMTCAGFLRFVCETHLLGRAAAKEAVEKVEATCSIAEVMHQQVGTLSKGYRRRLGLAQALVHDPPVLILDEPTDGLDPNQKHDVRRLIKKMSKNKCIIVSTHILEEVDAICNRMIVIDRGKIKVDSTPDSLRKQMGGSLETIFRNLTVGGKSPKSDGGKQ